LAPALNVDLPFDVFTYHQHFQTLFLSDHVDDIIFAHFPSLYFCVEINSFNPRPEQTTTSAHIFLKKRCGLENISRKDVPYDIFE
jgi:hypothetical protein